MKKQNIIFILLLLFFNVLMFNALAQISPGELCEAHAHLEGMSNCTLCHVLGDKVTDQKCLDCHKEIKSRIDQKKGYHASSEIGTKQCINCHSDHHGRKFDIVHFKTENFNHKLTGYALEGKHTEKKCEDCHKKENISDADIKKK